MFLILLKNKFTSTFFICCFLFTSACAKNVEKNVEKKAAAVAFSSSRPSVHDYYLNLKEILEQSFSDKKDLLEKLTQLENSIQGLSLSEDDKALIKILGDIKQSLSTVVDNQNGKILSGIEYLVARVKVLEKDKTYQDTSSVFKSRKFKFWVVVGGVTLGIAGFAGLLWFLGSLNDKAMKKEQKENKARLKSLDYEKLLSVAREKVDNVRAELMTKLEDKEKDHRDKLNETKAWYEQEAEKCIGDLNRENFQLKKEREDAFVEIRKLSLQLKDNDIRLNDALLDLETEYALFERKKKQDYAYAGEIIEIVDGLLSNE